MQEMKSGATSVGSIMAAMIYQIEEENKGESNIVNLQGQSTLGGIQRTMGSMGSDPSMAKLAGSIGSVETEVN
jgi:hypothetical protein